MKFIVILLITLALFSAAGGCTLFITMTCADVADSSWHDLYALYTKRMAEIKTAAIRDKVPDVAKVASDAVAELEAKALAKKDLDELTDEDVRWLDESNRKWVAASKAVYFGPWSEQLDAQILVARTAVTAKAGAYNDKITSGGPYEWTARARGRKPYLVINPEPKP